MSHSSQHSNFHHNANIFLSAKEVILNNDCCINDFSEEDLKIMTEALTKMEQFKDIPFLLRSQNAHLIENILQSMEVRQLKAGDFLYENGENLQIKYFLIGGKAAYTKLNKQSGIPTFKQVLFQKLEEKSLVCASENKKRAFELIQAIKQKRAMPVRNIQLGELFGSRLDLNSHLIFKARRQEQELSVIEQSLEDLQKLSVQAITDCIVLCLSQEDYESIFHLYIQNLNNLISFLGTNLKTVQIHDKEFLATEYFLHYIEELEFQNKDIIIQQDTPTDWLFFLSSGSIQVQKNLTELYKYGESQFILTTNFFNSKIYEHNVQATSNETKITKISRSFISMILSIKSLCSFSKTNHKVNPLIHIHHPFKLQPSSSKHLIQDQAEDTLIEKEQINQPSCIGKQNNNLFNLGRHLIVKVTQQKSPISSTSSSLKEISFHSNNLSERHSISEFPQASSQVCSSCQIIEQDYPATSRVQDNKHKRIGSEALIRRNNSFDFNAMTPRKQSTPRVSSIEKSDKINIGRKIFNMEGCMKIEGNNFQCLSRRNSPLKKIDEKVPSSNIEMITDAILNQMNIKSTEKANNPSKFFQRNKNKSSTLISPMSFTNFEVIKIENRPQTSTNYAAPNQKEDNYKSINILSNQNQVNASLFDISEKKLIKQPNLTQQKNANKSLHFRILSSHNIN